MTAQTVRMAAGGTGKKEGGGMGAGLTTIFIAGQMAGGGVLMLPGALVSTGNAGIALLLYFTLNGA